VPKSFNKRYSLADRRNAVKKRSPSTAEKILTDFFSAMMRCLSQSFGSSKFCLKTTLLIKSPRRCQSVQVINRGARSDVRQWGEGMGIIQWALSGGKCHELLACQLRDAVHLDLSWKWLEGILLVGMSLSDYSEWRGLRNTYYSYVPYQGYPL
jgi:hypothetical protein